MIWCDMIYLFTAIGLSPGGSITVHIYTQTMHRTTQITTNLWRVWAMPRLCEFYSGICLTTEEKAQKNLSQGKKNLSQGKKTSIRVQYAYYQNTHTLQNLHTHTHKHMPTHTHTHTHTHITKQYKSTTVQIKTNTVQNIPKLNSNNIINTLSISSP
jgi:hypothetical protein